MAKLTLIGLPCGPEFRQLSSNSQIADMECSPVGTSAPPRNRHLLLCSSPAAAHCCSSMPATAPLARGLRRHSDLEEWSRPASYRYIFSSVITCLFASSQNTCKRGTTRISSSFELATKLTVGIFEDWPSKIIFVLMGSKLWDLIQTSLPLTVHRQIC